MSTSDILQKTNDYTYLLRDKDKYISLQLPRSHTAEFNYNLALKAAKIILENNNKSSTRYRLGGKNWKVCKAGKISGFISFLSKIFDFFHPVGDDGITRYKISRTLFRGKRVKKVRTPQELKLKALLRKQFKNSVDRSNFRHYLTQANRKITKSAINDFKGKIRGSAPVSSDVLDFKKPFFEDPFTSLSALAFQKYEKEFTSKDFFVPEYCLYRIIKRGDKLHLVHNSAPIDIKESKKAVKLYKEFLIKHFGKEKIAYIEHLYRFKLDDIPSLTPEHVYRMNVGLTNLEYQDFDVLLIKLQQLNTQLESYDDTQLNESLASFLQKNKNLTGREAKGLFQYFEKLQSHATVGDLQSWLAAFNTIPSTSRQLTPELFNEILPIIQFTDEERKKCLTGREIFGFIRSGYTNASLGEYKPWVDQHQLTQFYPELIQNSSLTSYYEKLAHVVVKTHLAREHPTEGFRVGALIPAPPKEKGGPLRWYRVTSCVSNSYGIFSFTFESACLDPTLPGIKLFRSTASSRYALHSQSTVTNDLNNFNSPGFQGIGRTDQYEEKFFKDRTIPVWLGYNLKAQESLDKAQLARTVLQLKNAEKALVEEFNNKYRVKGLKEIIQSHDFLLNDLERKLHPISGFIALFGCLKLSKKWDYARLFQQLIKSYILKGKIKSKKHLNEKQDARKMVSILKKLYKLETSKSTRLKIQVLIHELQQNILTNEAKKIKIEARKELDNTILNKLQAKRQELEAAILAKDPQANEMAKELIEAWNQHAEDCGESIAEKKSGGVIMCGHSLGGACAQSHTVRWFTEKNRMPLPGYKCSLYEFDSPGTNQAQNQKFLKWGTEHSRLLENQFEIIRRQEAGDFVVTAGEEHLGAVYSRKQEKELIRWLRFDAAVLKRHLHSKHFPISLPVTAHETRFLEGKRINTFYTRTQLLELHKKWIAKKKTNPYRKKALKQIQDILDKNDYLCTFYTPHIQGVFNRQGIFKHKTAAESKALRKQFYDLKTKMWNLQNFMDPNTAETARKSVSPLFWNIIRKLLVRGKDTYKLNPLYTDKMGNFAVGLQGVMAKKKPKHLTKSVAASAA